MLVRRAPPRGRPRRERDGAPAGRVFRYGIASGRCERNPAPDLHGALRPVIVGLLSLK